jgi:alpha-2-macroglobulin
MVRNVRHPLPVRGSRTAQRGKQVLRRFASRKVVVSAVALLMAGGVAVTSLTPASGQTPSESGSSDSAQPNATTTIDTSAGSGNETLGGRPSYDKVTVAPASKDLSVLFAAPIGKLKSTSDANEIRWMFDRPVIDLTQIDSQADPSKNVTITPPIQGKFRWASTRQLVFTPNEALPAATAYKVTIQGITALDPESGPMVPFTTEFSTPTVRCSLSRADPPFFVVSCDQFVVEESLAENTAVIYRPDGFQRADYEPKEADLAAMKAKFPQQTATFLAGLDAAQKQKAVRQRVTLTSSGPCGDTPVVDPRDLCYRVRANGAVMRDANSSVRFSAGIVSKEGPLTSTTVTDGRLPTKRSIRFLNSCTQGCNPEGFSISSTTELVPQSLSGLLEVRDVKTGTTATYLATGQELPAELQYPLSFGWTNLQSGGSYVITLKAGAVSVEGETLDHSMVWNVTLGRNPAYLSLDTTGEQVTEESLKGLTYAARNVTAMKRVSRRVDRKDLVPMVRAYSAYTKSIIDLDKEKATEIALTTPLDKAKRQLIPFPADERGVYLVAVQPSAFVKGSDYRESDTRTEEERNAPTGRSGENWTSALVQRGDMGVTLKRSPANVLIAVTSLSTGKPVDGAAVALYGAANDPYWTGKTNADGTVTGPISREKLCTTTCDLIAVVEHNDGVAYAQSFWRAWGDESSYYAEDGFEFADDATEPLTDSQTTVPAPPKMEPGNRLLASLFTDRGVYRGGEEVHLKGIVRIETPEKLTMPEGIDELRLTVTDPRNNKLVEKMVKIKDGSFDTTFDVPVGGAQGRYNIAIDGGFTSFLVTSFRKPDFVVDVAPRRKNYIRGETARFDIGARYLFGAPMNDAPAAGRFTAFETSFDPVAGKEELGLSDMSWVPGCFGGFSSCLRLNDVGTRTHIKRLPVVDVPHGPLELQYESNVTDVTDQAFAGRATTIVHPGEYYVGIRQKGALTNVKEPVVVEVAAVTPKGGKVESMAGDVTLLRWDYITTKRLNADGSTELIGAYQSTPMGTQRVVLGTSPTAASFTVDKSGYYEASVTSTDSRGNLLKASSELYVLGEGYVSWFQDSQEPTVKLVADKKSYAAGDIARVLVQSPWEKAEGLLTIERNGVLASSRFTVQGSASAVNIPIPAEYAPNVFATVTLFKGRTAPPSKKDPSDPGRPQILSGTLELSVPPAEQELKVRVRTDEKQYRPGSPATASVLVRDANGKPAKGEVTLWAVDEGVLRLTGYQNPNALTDLYPYRSLEVATADSRMRLVAAVDENKGDGDNTGAPQPGGGGGEEGGDEKGESIRSDFRLLAAWSGKVKVGANGRATVAMKLPESLTAFRIIAVASSGAEKFGTGKSDITVRKPFQMLPALPRFVNVGDEFEAGVVVRNDTGVAGPALIKLQLPTDSPVALVGPAEVALPSVSSDPKEVRFKLRATGLGNAKFTFRASLNIEKPVADALVTTTVGSTPEAEISEADQSDALTIDIPVTVTRRYETVVENGSTQAGGNGDKVTIGVPKNAEKGLGGLDVTMSSSALAGLQEGITSLVEYPYGCLEQRSSRIRVLMELAGLADRYPLPGIKTGELRSVVQKELVRLAEYRTGDGGLSYWPGSSYVDHYLTPRVLLLLQDAKELGYTMPSGLDTDLASFLQRSIQEMDAAAAEASEGLTDINSSEPIVESAIVPNRAQIAWALARAGQPQKAMMNVLYRDRYELSYLEQIHLLRAQLESGLVGEKPDEMFKLVLGSVRIDGTRASVQERYDWGRWNDFSYLDGGNVHNTAALLSLLTRVDARNPLIGKMSAWLLSERTNGSWDNTLESGYALNALLDVAKNTEGTTPDFTAAVTLGAQELTSQKFSGSSLDSFNTNVALDRLSTALPDGKGDLRLTGDGKGTLHYTTRLRYVPDFASLKPLDQGISVERSYLPYESGQTTENPLSVAKTTFNEGDLVQVVVTITTAEDRRNLVIDDPLPAGLEALNTLLDSTSQADATGQRLGFDHTEIRDDRVLMFATYLGFGKTEARYIARATTAGTYMVAPTQAEDMYRPEIFGRNGSSLFTVIK